MPRIISEAFRDFFPFEWLILLHFCKVLMEVLEIMSRKLRDFLNIQFFEEFFSLTWKKDRDQAFRRFIFKNLIKFHWI